MNTISGNWIRMTNRAPEPDSDRLRMTELASFHLPPVQERCQMEFLELFGNLHIRLMMSYLVSVMANGPLRVVSLDREHCPERASLERPEHQL